MKKTNKLNYNIRNSNRGITLIALVLTILILMILSAVTINLIIGENGIIVKAKQAKEREKIAQITEKLELSKASTILNEEGNISFQNYIEQIQKDKIVNKDDIQETGIDNSIKIIVENKYVYLIEEIGGNGNIKITYLGKTEELDIQKPNVEIALKSTVTSISGKIVVRIIQNDTNSGIDINKCRWICTTSSELIGLDSKLYTGSFKSANEELELTFSTTGTYYLHVLTTDNSRNYVETVSEAISVLEEISWKYTGTGAVQTFIIPSNGTYTITCAGNKGINGTNGSIISGNIDLKKGDTLYMYIGNGQYNGASSYGGSGTSTSWASGNQSATAYAGGAATEVRLNNDTLDNRIIVAGGGVGGVSGNHHSSGNRTAEKSNGNANGTGNNAPLKKTSVRVSLSGGSGGGYYGGYTATGGEDYYPSSDSYSGTSYTNTDFSSISHSVCSNNGNGYVTISLNE